MACIPDVLIQMLRQVRQIRAHKGYAASVARHAKSAPVKSTRAPRQCALHIETSQKQAKVGGMQRECLRLVNKFMLQ
eukprot:1688687-Amphidinium_carterae.1